MEKNNRDIRLMARGSGVPLWEIAKRLNIGETTLYRKLRHELPAEEKARIFGIIEELKAAALS